MPNSPQASAAVALAPRMFETNSSAGSAPHCSTAVAAPNILLVGRNGSWGSRFMNFLATFGSELTFASPAGITPSRVRNGAFDVILLDSTVTPEERRRLASELLGSGSSIFYTFPVENGCWWLPALRCGQDCHGSPAFRRNEFPLEVERILRERMES